MTSGSEAPCSNEHGLPLQVGDTIAGKYRLLTMLDEGGMGSVWVAHNEALDVRVAIKFIRADLKGVEDARLPERLMNEARAAARLGHPAILRVYDFGQTPGGDPFLVMELLDGEDLATAVDRRGRIDPVKAVRSLLPIADALATAHDKNIIHRDLKPENIIMAETDEGTIQPKLIDFGVAKLELNPLERVTSVGATVGSPGYVAPEQARGDDATAQADIWSFCVVLYETITGCLPFTGKNYNALIRSIIEDEVEPITRLGVGDAELWAIIERGLVKDPDHRWVSIVDLGTALASWLLAQGVTEDVCGTLIEAIWSPKSKETRDAFSSTPPPGPVNDMWTQLVMEQVKARDSVPDIDSQVPSDSSPSSQRGSRPRLPRNASPLPPSSVRRDGAADPRRTLPSPSDQPPSGVPVSRPPLELADDGMHVVIDEVDQARGALERYDIEGAVEHVERALLAAMNVEDPAVAAVLRLSERLFEDVYLARLGGGATQIDISRAEDFRIELTPDEALVVARIALGAATVDDVCVSLAHRREALRTLVRLLRRSIIETF